MLQLENLYYRGCLKVIKGGENVKILNVTIETTYPTWVIIAGVIAAVVVLFLVLTSDFSEKIKKSSIVKLFCSFVLAAVIVILTLVTREDHRIIETNISDNVSFNEVISKYEVREIRGEICVLKEIEKMKK